MFYSVINFIINNQAHPRQDRADPQNIVFIIDFNRYNRFYIILYDSYIYKLR